MKYYLKLILIVMIGAMLSACASVEFDHTSTALMPNKHTKLANGHPVVIGYNKPKPQWKCTKITANNYLWSKEKMRAMAHLSIYSLLVEQAKSYANSKKINPDYIYIQQPSNDVYVGGFDTGAFSHRVWMYYYQCKRKVK